MIHKEIKIGATYSTLSSDELIRYILPQYEIPTPSRCDFWVRGLNDTYKVTTRAGNYSLRVYRHDWRSVSEIDFELDALVYLKAAGCEVAYPIEKSDGGYITVIGAPEGVRYITLTKWIEGSPLDFEIEGSAARFGKAVARLHALSAGLQPGSTRRQLDLDHLLHAPIRSIKQFIAHREADVRLLDGYESILSEMVSSISERTDFGFCHGDFHGYNAHELHGVVTHFDFDCCGYGSRAYDLATYKWNVTLRKKESEWWPKFLAGYTAERDFSERDLALIEPYMAIRDLWLLGLHIDNARDMSYGWLNDKYIDKRLSFLTRVVEGTNWVGS